MKYRIFFILATLFITSINVCSNPQKTVSKPNQVIKKIEFLCTQAENVIDTLRKDVNKQGHNPELAIAKLLHINDQAIEQINNLKESPQKNTFLHIFSAQRDLGSLLSEFQSHNRKQTEHE